MQTSPTGAVSMTALGGAIVATDAVAIYANTPTLVAGRQIDVQIEGNRGALNALAGGNISITAISKDNATSRIAVGSMSLPLEAMCS